MKIDDKNTHISTPNFCFAVTAAKWALPGAPVLLRGDTRAQFEQARQLGYDAIEIHLRTPEDVSAEELSRLQKEYGVSVSAVATGLAKLVDKLSLIDPDPAIRIAAIKRVKDFIDWASVVKCSIILGSLRGNLPEGEERSASEQWIRSAMTELVSYAEKAKVVLLLEVINRYENNYLNSAAETNQFILSFHSNWLKTHLDTFHMNIEEADMIQAILETGSNLGYIHFADNTRHACGEGSLDFKGVINALNAIHYTGCVSVECLPLPDGYAAADASIRYLKSLID